MEFQNLSEQMAELTLGIPGMDHLQAFKRCRFRAGPIKTVILHHREPDGKTFQIVAPEFLEKSADNSLSVLAHRSGG